MLSEIIQRNKEQFLSLCKSYGIKSLFVFGSAAKGHFKETSDVDLVVELLEKDPLNRGEMLMSLWDKLVYDGSKEEILL